MNLTFSFITSNLLRSSWQNMYRFYFDFSATYVGVGMICPHIINVSLLVGAILSWGIMWPLIADRKGDWYSADLSASSLHGIQGYRVTIQFKFTSFETFKHFESNIHILATIGFKQHKSNGETFEFYLSIRVVFAVCNDANFTNVLGFHCYCDDPR